MRIQSNGQPTHLGYCTNIHAGDAWQDVFPTVRQNLPQVRDALNWQSAMGIGLRLSCASADELHDEAAFQEFVQWLDEGRFYVYTINGFPYGTFHGERVKEEVYKPDWTEPERLRYTCRLADLLCRLAPPENYGSISTLPGTYKDWEMPGTQALIAENLIQAVAHCVRLEQKSGITIALALEPEPSCLLETMSETVDFFENQLFSRVSVQRLASLTGISESVAEQAMRTHIGVCYDVCHSAVEFEEPVSVIARLRTAGIEIVKIQLSSALEIGSVNEASLRHLSRFDEPVYLHQVVEQRGDTLTRYADVPAAMSAIRHRLEARSTLHPALQLTINGSPGYVMASDEEAEACWRVHYHVPVFMEKTEHFTTTQQSLCDVLRLQNKFNLTRHLEVETYTWDVLPEQYRQQPVHMAVANEVQWIMQRLT